MIQKINVILFGVQRDRSCLFVATPDIPKAIIHPRNHTCGLGEAV